MEFYLNQLSELDFGQILLLGFWGTCVVGFYSILLYVISMKIRELTINLYRKSRYGKIRENH